MPNVSNITPPRVPLVDNRTGLVSREWYLFFLSLFNFANSPVDHGELAGLSDDDHTQYHNNARGDLRYAALSHVGTGGGAHADAVSGGPSGFMTGGDKAKLDGVGEGASVSSVELSAPDDFDVTGSPVTSAGTLSFSWSTSPTSDNTPNALVKRGESGEVSVGDVTTTSLTSTSTTTENVLAHTLIQKVAGDYGWNDITSFIDTRNGGNAPSLTTYRDGIKLWEFSAGVTKEVFSNYHIDHDYKIGTVVYPHVHWTPNTTSTGTVRWGFEYTVAKGFQQSSGSDYAATTTVYVEQTIDANSQYRHFTAEVVLADAIPSTNLEPDAIILMRVFRDAAHANDTFPDPVYLTSIDLHYQVERASTKNKAPDFYA